MFAHHSGEIGISGTHHAYIHLTRSAVAKHLEGVLLKHPQQFYLAVKVQFAYLVKKYSTTVGECETPLAVGYGTGECPLAMSEHLAFEQ